MTFGDWLLDIALIGIVVLQLRGMPLTARTLLLPVVLVVWAATNYLHGVPTAGDDLLLVVPAALVGLGLGVGVGILTRVYRNADGVVFARATVWAAALWVLGMGVRLVFQIYVTHGGGESVGRFSIAHHLDAQAWVTALVLMAFGQVLARTVVVWLRGENVRRAVPVPSRG